MYMTFVEFMFVTAWLMGAFLLGWMIKDTIKDSRERKANIEANEKAKLFRENERQIESWWQGER